MLDHHATHAVRRAINDGVEVGAEVVDDRHRCIQQVHLDAAEPVDAASWAVLVAEAYHDALDAVAVPSQHETQPALGVIGQCAGQRDSLAVDIDVNAFPFRSPDGATWRI